MPTLSKQFILPIFTIIKYEISGWNGGSSSYSKIISPTKEIRIMGDAKPRNSCRGLLKSLEILLLPCEYICPLINYILMRILK
jgi:hypothetical protein